MAVIGDSEWNMAWQKIELQKEGMEPKLKSKVCLCVGLRQPRKVPAELLDPSIA
jgi:hypothetical protein